jgi:pimeloyl-ACP methyl ester carboxylesterase
VLVDLKGFGSSPKPDDRRYAPMDQAELVHRLVRQRDLVNVNLVGHSLGGGVSLLTALLLRDAATERLKRLVIVSGACYPQKLPPFARLAHYPRLSSAMMRALGPRAVARRVLRSIVYDPGCITRSQIEGYADALRGPETMRVLIQAALQIVPKNLDRIIGRFPEIDVPALVLWGRQDRVIPVALGERLARDLPHARLVVLDGCGHLPHEERPGESVEALEAFLEGRDAAKGG